MLGTRYMTGVNLLRRHRSTSKHLVGILRSGNWSSKSVTSRSGRVLRTLCIKPKLDYANSTTRQLRNLEPKKTGLAIPSLSVKQHQKKVVKRAPVAEEECWQEQEGIRKLCRNTQVLQQFMLPLEVILL